MSDLSERLAVLAERGAPRGFDEVFAAASGAAEELGDDVDEIATSDPNVIPFVTLEPERRRHRRPLTSMIAAAGMASLLVVGTLAISALIGSGGAGSPEAAVRQLADAVSHEDPLAAADVLAPSELKSLHGTVDTAEKKAQELKLVQTASAPLAGVDLNVDNLGLSTEMLADGYAKVTLTGGTLSASTQKSHFSALMQKVLRDSSDNHAQVDLADIANNTASHLGVFVVAVREDGRWYVSAAYTALEYWRELGHLPAADFGSGEKAAATLGADTPDAAVQDGVRALQNGDWTRLISLARPDELPVYDYRAALTTLARSSDYNSAFTITKLSTSSTVDGDTAHVDLTASGKTSDGTWSVHGGCVDSATSDGQSSTGLCNAATELSLAAPLTGLDTTSSITVIREHGRWFLSPVDTVLDVVDHFIENLDQRELYSLLGVPQQLPAEATIQLGTPVHVDGSQFATHVYSFTGHKGQTIVGTAVVAKPTQADQYSPPANVLIFDTNGNLVNSDALYGEGAAPALPADGTYKVTVRLYRGDATVTLYDAKTAPAAAKNGMTGAVENCDVNAPCPIGTVTPPGIVSPPAPAHCTKNGLVETCSVAASSPLPEVPTSVPALAHG